jgi:hypothetical protein
LAATNDRRQRGQNPSSADFFNKIRRYRPVAASFGNDRDGAQKRSSVHRLYAINRVIM